MMVIDMLRSAWVSVKEGVVDFRSQEVLQRLLLSLFVLGTGMGFVFGFVTESFSNSCCILLTTAVVAAVVCVPSWPLYKQNSISYAPHDPSRIARLYGEEYVAASPAAAADPASKGEGEASATSSGKKHKASSRKKQ